MGEHKEAIESYDKAIAINPDDALAKKNRDQILEKLSNKKGRTFAQPRK